jgi:hypothetical protein
LFLGCGDEAGDVGLCVRFWIVAGGTNPPLPLPPGGVGAFHGVGEADDGVDGADADGGVGFEVQDAGDVSEGSGEGLLGVGFAVGLVGGGDSGVPGLDVGLGGPDEEFGGVFVAQAAEGDEVAHGAEEKVDALAVLGVGEGLELSSGGHSVECKGFICKGNPDLRILFGNVLSD